MTVYQYSTDTDFRYWW